MAKETKNSIYGLMALLPSVQSDFGSQHEATKLVKQIIARFGGDEGAKFVRNTLLQARNANNGGQPRTNVRRLGAAPTAAFTSPARSAGLKRRAHPAAKQHDPEQVVKNQGEQLNELTADELRLAVLDMIDEGWTLEQAEAELQQSGPLLPWQTAVLHELYAHLPIDGDVVEDENLTGEMGEIGYAIKLPGNDGLPEQPAGDEQRTEQAPEQPEIISDAELLAAKGKSPASVAKQFGRLRILATIQHLGKEVNEGWNDAQAAKFLMSHIG